MDQPGTELRTRQVADALTAYKVPGSLALDVRVMSTADESHGSTRTPMMTVVLAVGMVTVALVNTALMAWLWRFPMKPDPTGRDPHEVSSAPRGATNLHRGLGYLFALAYLALLFEMVPRLWAYR